MRIVLDFLLNALPNMPVEGLVEEKTLVVGLEHANGKTNVVRKDNHQRTACPCLFICIFRYLETILGNKFNLSRVECLPASSLIVELHLLFHLLHFQDSLLL
jgi:hypothetical protein